MCCHLDTPSGLVSQKVTPPPLVGLGHEPDQGWGGVARKRRPSEYTSLATSISRPFRFVVQETMSRHLDTPRQAGPAAPPWPLAPHRCVLRNSGISHLYQPAERLTHSSPFPVMPTKVGIHAFPMMHAAKSWMPDSAGMTMWARFVCESFA